MIMNFKNEKTMLNMNEVYYKLKFIVKLAA